MARCVRPPCFLINFSIFTLPLVGQYPPLARTSLTPLIFQKNVYLARRRFYNVTENAYNGPNLIDEVLP